MENELLGMQPHFNFFALHFLVSVVGSFFVGLRFFLITAVGCK